MKKSKVLIVLLCGLFFIVDRFLKWQALHEWHNDYLLNKFFGWHPFLNPGVAFGIPVPNWVTVVSTALILILILFLFFRFQTSDVGYQMSDLSLPLVFFGALSNFIDRVWYGHTVDYFLILTGVINLADAMIVVGFVVYWLYHRNTSTRQH